MKTAVQVFSWIAIIIGMLAFIGGFEPLADGSYDMYAFLGGGLFFTQGLLTLIYIAQNKENWNERTN